MFDWLGDIIGGIGDAIGSVFSFLGEQISNVIFDTILQWFYTIIYNAVADFFTMMSLPQMMKQGRCLWYGLRIQKSRFSWL